MSWRIEKGSSNILAVYDWFEVVGGHIFRQMKTPDTIWDLDTLKNIWAKFGLNPFSSFSGEDFFMLTDDRQRSDDGRKVMAIAHLLVRWAKNNQIALNNALLHG